MKFLINILLLLAVIGCNRKVHQNKTIDTLTKDSTATVIDTTKKAVSTQQSETTYYGDTLTGNLYFPVPDTINEDEYNPYDTATHIIRIPYQNSIYVDSLESNGIKIKVGIIPTKGGFKAHINAVSKPKETVKTTNTNAIEQRGLVQNTTNKTDQSHTAKAKDTETVNELYKWIGLTLLGLGILVLIALAIYLYIKNKINGKSL